MNSHYHIRIPVDDLSARCLGQIPRLKRELLNGIFSIKIDNKVSYFDVKLRRFVTFPIEKLRHISSLDVIHFLHTKPFCRAFWKLSFSFQVQYLSLIHI